MSLPARLDLLYHDYNRANSASDPIDRVRPFTGRADQEIAGFCAGALAQLRMSTFKHTIQVNRCATRGVDLNFVSVCLFFIAIEPFTRLYRKQKAKFLNNNYEPRITGISRMGSTGCEPVCFGSLPTSITSLSGAFSRHRRGFWYPVRSAPVA